MALDSVGDHQSQGTLVQMQKLKTPVRLDTERLQDMY
jgi:hypothetical protein